MCLENQREVFPGQTGVGAGTLKVGFVLEGADQIKTALHLLAVHKVIVGVFLEDLKHLRDAFDLKRLGDCAMGSEQKEKHGEHGQPRLNGNGELAVRREKE